jgi:excinuclease ABC subunit C
MLNGNEQLIYVGKAKCLRTRLLGYFRPKSRDPKAGRILRQAAAIVWEEAPSEFAALLRELELIRRWRPRFNVQGQPGRRRPTYLCVDRRPAPYLFLSRFPPRDVLACFGPIPATWRATEAVRRLNDHYRLRDCPQAQTMVFAEQLGLFPLTRAPGCLRYEIKTCLGPCVGACARRDYHEQVRSAQRFLRGQDLSLLDSLTSAMARASEALEFEKAAALRDRLDILRWLEERLSRLRSARDKQSFIYPVRGHDGSELWYLIHGGRIRAAVPAATDGIRSRSVDQVIRKVFQSKPLEKDPLPVEEMDAVLLVVAWFRRHPEERARLVSPQEINSRR